MSEYRYFTCDLLTNMPISDIPLYGVYLNKKLNGAGDFNGSFKLGTDVLNDPIMLSATQPGRTALYVERDGVLIWGGIIWTRMFESQGKTIQLTAQTFESYFNRVVLLEHVIQQSVEQVQIFKSVVDAMQAQDGSNIGLTFAMPIPDTGILRTVLIPGYEFHWVQEAITQLLGSSNSFEYTIAVEPSATPDRPDKIIRVGNLKLNPTVSSLSYDYPGTITQYWWPESANKGGTKFAGRGYGSGNKAPTAIVVDGSKIDEGYPALWNVSSYNDVADALLLSDKVRETAVLGALPYVSPTFMLKGDVGAGFTGWNTLGAPISIYIEDERFPNGKVAQSRMLGWSVSVGADSGGTDIVQFVLEGDDSSA